MAESLVSRRRVFILGLMLLVVLWAAAALGTASASAETMAIVRSFGIASLALLYLTLAIGPACRVLPRFPGKLTLFRARRVTGILSFLFAFLHAGVSFLGQLGGFGGLVILPGTYRFPLILGAVSLLVLLVLALTANDLSVRKIGFRRWKILHRFVYIAGLAVLAHSLVLGARFQSSGAAASVILWSLFVVLLALRGFDLDRRRRHRWPVVAGTVLVLGTVWIVVAAVIPLELPSVYRVGP